MNSKYGKHAVNWFRNIGLDAGMEFTWKSSRPICLIDFNRDKCLIMNIGKSGVVTCMFQRHNRPLYITFETLLKGFHGDDSNE